MAATSKYGSWGNGTFTSNSNFNALLPYINGFHYRLEWSDIETSQDVWNWTYFDTQLRKSLDNGIYVGFQIMTGDNAPAYIFSNPSQHSFTNDRGTWPYYLDTFYTTRWYNMKNQVINHISTTYSSDEKSRILYWQSAEGSTGDPGPYKGTVPTTPFDFTITEDYNEEWDQYKRPYWTELYNDLASDLPGTALMINPGNDGQNFQWGRDNLPNCWFKAGNFTHNYNIPGEKFGSTRLRGLWTQPTNLNRVRGEFENVDDTTWWDDSRNKNFFDLAVSSIHAGVDMFNISHMTMTNNNWYVNNYPMLFLRKYGGDRVASEAKKGFIVLRKMIDIADTTLYSEGTYGDLITSNTSLRNQYNNNKAAINASDIPQSQKDDKQTRLLLTQQSGNYKFLNLTRIANLQALYPNAGYMLNEVDLDIDAYNNEFGANYVPDNYYKFVNQILPETTSEPLWRIGSTSSYFGRFARQFKISANRGEMFFSTDSGLTVEGNNQVAFTITYYDQGTGFWSLNCATCKGKTEIGVMQNTNTNTWKQVTFNTSYYLGDKSLENGADFTLKYLSGLNTPFCLIEFQTLS